MLSSALRFSKFYLEKVVLMDKEMLVIIYANAVSSVVCVPESFYQQILWEGHRGLVDSSDHYIGLAFAY